MVEIRLETDADIPLIHSVVLAAFGSPNEAMLVDRLRQAKAAPISLVAEMEGKIVGHALFSPVTTEFNLFDRHFLGLAPLSVHPAYQRQGIGSRLIRRGLELALASGTHAVFVLGSPTYYPRFGFTRVDDWNLICDYDVPPEDFMAVTLRPHGLDGCGGLVSYHPLFKELGL